MWHSEALAEEARYFLVGRRAEPTAEFAARYGYRRWSVDLKEALADPAVEAVIVANPSELHARTALQCLAHGKPTLVEIPIAMSHGEAERVVLEAERRGLTLGVVHPMRFRRERVPLRERLAHGEEHIRHIHGRFFIHRLKNIGATGYRRSWIDNLLWHHTTHLLDSGAVDAGGRGRSDPFGEPFHAGARPAYWHPDGGGAADRDRGRPEPAVLRAPTTPANASTTR